MMAEEIYQELVRQIILGVLRPRERLVEADLSQRLGVSRTLLREMFQRLEGVGLVTLNPNRGAVVRDFNPKEIEDLYFVRSLLERAVAPLIEEQVTAEDLEQLNALNRQFEDACERQDMAAMIWTNITFHRRMSQVSGNPFLCRLLDISRLQTNQIRYVAWTNRDRVRESRQDHQDMLAALLRHDAAAFEAALFRHVGGGKKDYLEIYSHHYQETPAGPQAGRRRGETASPQQSSVGGVAAGLK
jgi:DNA-binding GntR family transcriptional regulator